MSVNDMKITALTNRIAKLYVRRHNLLEQGNNTGAAIASIAIRLYEDDLEALLEACK
ncbi:hypothetical protein LRR81_08790 [Metabacillus sp. GX 13764]|uniref:hypothetical protein n=1 Tax=Metabacillus kandeliae TaxID=2900151 RepID=UPI001E5C7B17|nr:hypothetical protein [Metabacillus kandeliae]MCD7034330.1 hypothetical protein [Metabacillus kandeliae]